MLEASIAAHPDEQGQQIGPQGRRTRRKVAQNAFLTEDLLRAIIRLVRARSLVMLFVLVAGSGIVRAQWLNYKTPGIPRLPNGAPNLKAPAPRTAEGKPDFSGMWFANVPSRDYCREKDCIQEERMAREQPALAVYDREVGLSTGTCRDGVDVVQARGGGHDRRAPVDAVTHRQACQDGRVGAGLELEHLDGDVQRAGAYRLEPTAEPDVVRAAELEEEYADLGLGFVDASVIALCERLDEPKVATLDRRDFSIVVPRHVPALELLPH